ncbi:MAG: hypothetical protein HQL15_03180 [Candidatus Omnitrophica bacterium]|nr:hypothetical protein [Candidatus Omnitrophota bacterium]
MAWVLFLFVFVSILGQSWGVFKAGWSQLRSFGLSLGLFEKFLWLSGFILVGVILIIIILAGMQPIHLTQETDCMQYHYALPRQHLILGSFAHIPWAADDLFLLPLDFSLSPFWFATEFPNKIPQLIVMFGLIAVLIRLAFSLRGAIRYGNLILIVFAVLGSRGLGIQMGTGMLDLVVAYLFFASLDSFRQGQWGMGAVEFTFFFWSKPLLPLQVLFVLLLLGMALVMARYFKWPMIEEFKIQHWQKGLCLFVVLSVFVAGPFIMKSIYYAATPLFPIEPGMLGNKAAIQSNPQAWMSLQKASFIWMHGVKDNYGHGRGIIAFIKHWWLLAVPEKGVNNSFDYPMGLSYLLFIGPFLFYLVRDFMGRKVSVGSWVVIFLWMLWWLSTQQARFLYIPILMVFLLVSVRLAKPSRSLLIGLMVALLMQVVSLLGAHRKDIFHPSWDVLREQDRRLVEMSRAYQRDSKKGYIDCPSHEVAYAQFPVRVIKENLPHTILFDI